ncbi:glycosyltransferase family 2 protein [Mariniphaga sediminis]|uniref:Glycosyltransferase family 2 protein n=1 Tax=Mariniphaga sediminis TaxID=1628158 RepID=A0A399CYH9_9BACT|nr:glycosyltransferase family 2 protein [Mariniphaga sediminis]RIH64266.1 glycosyltransferase family 2 protein [Mariniphaga sediminis]RIH66545.1 glycosyltransferase family 2 protein [Mariniphaga sediminis]
MKVCGFTFIRNAEKFDFPVVEAITSIMPLCDHFVVAVGNSEDKTRQMIEKIDPDKITIVDTVWDQTLQKGGAVYAAETDKAFDAIPPEFDWCFYIQGDEVVHEKYLFPIERAMRDNLRQKQVEGLLFGYKHFYGTYDYVGNSRKWYRNEIRIIRNDKTIRSYRDAQGFRKKGRKLNVVPTGAEIYHYGWVRPPKFMQDKINEVRRFYDGISTAEAKKIAGEKEFNYSGKYDALAKFDGSHPRVMQDRIDRMNWQVYVDVKKVKMKLKYRVLYFIEKTFGVRLFEYRNYKVLK